MNTLCLAAACGSLLLCPAAFAQGQKDDSEGIGLFDFEDIEKQAREESGKREEPAKSELPEEVRTALATLKTFQELTAAARDEMILRNRKKLAEDLKRSAEKAPAAALREALILEADAVADSEAGAPLPAPGRKYSKRTAETAGVWEDPKEQKSRVTFALDGTVSHINGHRGVWRWLDEAKGIIVLDWAANRAAHLYQITSGSPLTVSCITNEGKKSSKVKREGVAVPVSTTPDRDALLQKANAAEAAINAAVGKAVEGRRNQLLEDLRKRSAGAGGELAKAFAREAAAVKEHRTESVPNARKLAGTWKRPDGKTWQFRSDGTLLADQKPAGTWVWAKAVDQNTVLICLLPQRDWMLGRFSTGKKGLLRINQFGADLYDVSLSP